MRAESEILSGRGELEGISETDQYCIFTQAGSQTKVTWIKTPHADQQPSSSLHEHKLIIS